MDTHLAQCSDVGEEGFRASGAVDADEDAGGVAVRVGDLGRGRIQNVMWSAAVLSGSPSALLRRGPLRTVRACFPGTRLKQVPRARGQAELLVPVRGRRCAVARSGRA
jgi:hypothetical protein